MTWEDVISYKQTDSAYEAFLNKFTFLYEKVSEKFVVTVKSRTLKNPWITKLIVKSSKPKQRLYDKFLKSKSFLKSQRSFEMHLKGFDSSLEETTLSDEEVKRAYFSLKGGKSPDFDEVSSVKMYF